VGNNNRREVDERERRAEQRRDIVHRININSRTQDIVRDLGVSEGTVYRWRAAINEGRTLEDEEEASQTGATGGTYHGQYFRDAAEALGLRVSKTRVPGREGESDYSPLMATALALWPSLGKF
jgi:transposase-like protein